MSEKIVLQPVVYEDQEDYSQSEKLLLNGKVVWKARDLANNCPEDATLSRDMTNVREIIKLMQLIEGKKLEFLPIKECESRDEFEDFNPNNL